jgi:hypothetical protein
VAKKMMRRVLVFGSVLTFGVSLFVFSQAQSQTAPASPEDPLPALSVPKDYRYNAGGRRDPFVNPVPRPKGTVAAPTPPRPPGLKGIPVREALIAGVVTSKVPSMNVVIISVPGAKAPYFAHVGDELYDAVVKSIKLDTVTFALTTPPPADDPKAPREIVRKVRPKSGEDK